MQKIQGTNLGTKLGLEKRRVRYIQGETRAEVEFYNPLNLRNPSEKQKSVPLRERERTRDGEEREREEKAKRLTLFFSLFCFADEDDDIENI